MNTLHLVLIIIGIYIIYSNLLCKETFATSPSTLTQLRSTSTENLNQQFVCKDCGSTNILLIGNYNRRRNYG